MLGQLGGVDFNYSLRGDGREAALPVSSGGRIREMIHAVIGEGSAATARLWPREVSHPSA